MESTAERVRLTISVTPEVHEAFTRLATASGMSLGRAMGEWLGDTLEAVEFTASKVEEARAAPKLVMREMHAYALGLADETGALLSGLKTGNALRDMAATPDARSAPSGAANKLRAMASPPSSNTGGKVPQQRQRKGKR